MRFAIAALLFLSTSSARAELSPEDIWGLTEFPILEEVPVLETPVLLPTFDYLPTEAPVPEEVDPYYFMVVDSINLPVDYNPNDPTYLPDPLHYVEPPHLIEAQPDWPAPESNCAVKGLALVVGTYTQAAEAYDSPSNTWQSSASIEAASAVRISDGQRACGQYYKVHKLTLRGSTSPYAPSQTGQASTPVAILRAASSDTCTIYQGKASTVVSASRVPVSTGGRSFHGYIVSASGSTPGGANSGEYANDHRVVSSFLYDGSADQSLAPNCPYHEQPSSNPPPARERDNYSNCRRTAYRRCNIP